jgi:RNA polymerase sigma-70 factor (ECF subfamily)
VIFEVLLEFLIATAALRYPDEPELIARLQRRDPAAITDLYDRYGRLVYALIVRVVRDRTAAEDLVQEVFLRVWNRAASFDAMRGSLGPWLLTISRNHALDYLKSSQGKVWRSPAEVTDRIAGGGDPESEYVDSVRLQQVRMAMDKLTPSQRQVLELAYFEGLSQSEMADRIQQPLGTVKTWIRTALKTLREELGASVAAP